MAEPAEKLKPVEIGPKRKIAKPYDLILGRRTREQVLALCGPIGCGMKDISTRVAGCFKRYGFEVIPVKASDLIIEAIKTLEGKGLLEKKHQLEDWDSEDKRIDTLQSMGDLLRGKYGSDIVAQLFIKKVSTHRQGLITDEELEKGQVHKESSKENGKPVIWILDSLKHPEEVKLLRLVYEKMFNLIGVLSSFETKKHFLVENFGVTLDRAADLISRDESEEISHGQKLIKTLQFGDFFIRNSQFETNRVVDSIERCVKLILGDNSITPTHGEYAMYQAQSSAFRSGCMSRQVGAAIVNSHGEIVATGFNDAPQFGGGVYTEDSPKDGRCFKIFGGECKNDQKKTKMKKKIKELLSEKNPKIVIDDSLISYISDHTGISDLTEYCRAVHAEMDAITSAARKGISLRDGSIYVTTFPCHNCAKHIIASGIKKAYYIEPYEKSLALSMHNDSTSTDGRSNTVAFLPFEGVAPRQYQNRFCSTTNKKVGGKFAGMEVGEETPAYAQLLDCFPEYEVKIVDTLTGNGL